MYYSIRGQSTSTFLCSAWFAPSQRNNMIYAAESVKDLWWSEGAVTAPSGVFSSNLLLFTVHLWHWTQSSGGWNSGKNSSFHPICPSDSPGLPVIITAEPQAEHRIPAAASVLGSVCGWECWSKNIPPVLHRWTGYRATPQNSFKLLLSTENIVLFPGAILC